ncbi:MAG: sulfotransferase domain-containing protein, partial [Rubrobacteraceae bacterium]
TWLAAMMDELEGQSAWREPLVGALFGNFYQDRARRRANTEGKHFIMGETFRESWLGSIRNFVLSEATARFPEAAPNGYVVVKEPNGTIGAPLLLEAMPESRLVLLVRDPRDVTASSMDARRKGGFRGENRNEGERDTSPNTNPDAFVKKRAKTYMQQVGSAKKAYDAHKGPKTLVRYEDLRADTLGTMKRLYSEIGVSVDEDELTRSVEKHSWESIPEEKKGEGKFYRKATPGGWREDLTPEQARAVEEITAPLLAELYPDTESG